MESSMNRKLRKLILKKAHTNLSWFLIECRLLYYYPDKFSAKLLKKLEVEDLIYDLAERKYIRLCKLLNLPNTVQSMVEVDFNRPSVNLAMQRLFKISLDIRKKNFTGCQIRYRLGVQQKRRSNHD
jgi:hypothetical protein